MSQKIKVLILNNYPFDAVWEEVKRDEKPAHHLYGIDYLDRQGYEVIIVPFKKNAFLLKLSNWVSKYIPIYFGDLDQQWSALKMMRQCDIVYSPCQTQTWVLSYLRAIGLIRKPIVALAHHPMDKGKMAFIRRPFLKLGFAGTDAYPALSEEVANQINALANKNLSKALYWGPDLNYFKPSKNFSGPVVVAGRTARDFSTFGNAASKTHVVCKIFCLQRDYKPLFEQFSKNVEVLVNNKAVTYRELEKTYQDAKVLAIPFEYSKNLCGLTSVNDALALGKPILMTRTEFIDIDIEKEGIGFWVNNRDEADWKKMLEKIDNDPELVERMGEKARKLAEEKYNYETFCIQIEAILKNALQKHK